MKLRKLQPVLISGLLFGLLISNLVLIKEYKANQVKADAQQAIQDKRQNEELAALQKTTDNINANTNKGVEEIKRLQRLTSCLLVEHDSDLRVSQSIRNKCSDDIVTQPFADEKPNSPSPSPSQSEPPTRRSQPAQNNPTPPDNEGVILDLPLLPRVNIPSPF